MLSNFNKYAGVKLLNTPNTLTYTLFNYFYNRFITNQNGADEEIKFFHKNGYLFPNVNFKKEILLLNKVLDVNEKIDNQNEFKYILNNERISAIKNILNTQDFKNLLNKLEKYFNSKIYLIDAKVTRNFPIEKENEHKQNIYSNNYHVDYYTINLLKMFINLHDVDETQGPMNFYSKENSKKFIKFNNYKDRSNYEIKNEKDLGLIKNVGSSGDLLICSTPQCLHRASSPEKGKYRDMLFLSFAIKSIDQNSKNNLFKFEKSNYNDIWNCTSVLTKKFCKPKSFRKQIKMFAQFYKNRIN